MASTFASFFNLCSGLASSKHSSIAKTLIVSSSHTLNPFGKRDNSAFLCSAKNRNRARASSEGIPTEQLEDAKFVPLNAEDPRYGPPALLLLGFEVEEAPKILQLLKDMEGEFLEVIYCTEEMMNRSLWEAVQTKQADLKKVKVAKSVPRICLLSGLSGEEMMMFIDAFPEAGIKPAVFAALVPNSADKPLQELIEEIMGDHEAMSENQQNSQEAV